MTTALTLDVPMSMPRYIFRVSRCRAGCRARGARRIHGDVARQAVADQQRTAAEIADAQQGHVVSGEPLEGLLEHVLVQNGVARARAAGVDRRRQVVALAVDAAGEFAGNLEGV